VKYQIEEKWAAPNALVISHARISGRRMKWRIRMGARDPYSRLSTPATKAADTQKETVRRSCEIPAELLAFVSAGCAGAIDGFGK